MYCPSWEARRDTTVWDCGGGSASRSVAQRRSRMNLAGCPSVTEVDSALISIVGSRFVTVRRILLTVPARYWGQYRRSDSLQAKSG